jgi:hypothetical protein
LQAAYIGDPVLSTRVAAGVNLILTTVASFAALMPQTSVLPMAQKMAHQQVAIPKASDLKKQLDQQVCGPDQQFFVGLQHYGCTVRWHAYLPSACSNP